MRYGLWDGIAYDNIRLKMINLPVLKRANAAYHNSRFRNFLLCNENRLRLEGVTDIIDLDDSYTQVQEEAQFNAYVTDRPPLRSQ